MGIGEESCMVHGNSILKGRKVMREFEDVRCPECGGMSAASAWGCDAVEHKCVCPKCGAQRGTEEVFGMWHTLGLVSLPVPASPLNEW